MSLFPLQIITAGGVIFEGKVQRLLVRTSGGDLCVLTRHIDCIAPLTEGQVDFTDEAGKQHLGFCSGGILSVKNGCAVLIPTVFRWSVGKN